MKLQLALDDTLEDALRLLDRVAEYIDIAEVGTPLLLREGLKAIVAVQDRCPGLPVLADAKIADAGALEARLAFDAGASFTTVLAAASDATIKGAVDSAMQADGKIVVDLIGAPEPVTRAAQVLALGADMICVHAGADRQAVGETPFRALREVRARLPDALMAVAGGLGPGNIGEVADFNPDVVVVGSAVAGATDPVAAVKAIREVLNRP